MLLSPSADFFSIFFFFFSKNSFRNAIKVSNNLDPDQERNSVGPDLGPNCLQRLLTDVKSHLYQGRTSYMYMHNVTLNMHAQLASEARLLNFVQSHHLL